jgi:alpha/beta superfamily hydrolase
VTEQVAVESRDGLRLEAEVDETSDPEAALVICHAHPQLQGTMKSPLLLAIRDAMVAHGWTVVRFNFRGVGGSAGEFGDGVAEVDDALGALDFARERASGSTVCLAGWSFGGAVALRAASRAREIAACAVVAPSVTPKAGLTAGLPPGAELGLGAAVLVVCGSNDDIVSPSACREWAEAAGARYEEIPAANHFFWAKYETVTDVVAAFLVENARQPS